MKRLITFFAAVYFLQIAIAGAQSFIASAQQQLKTQGFYQGEISGQQDAETTAAVRRYQIRNGLKVTGEFDADTQRLLGLTGAPTGQYTPTPSPGAPEMEKPDNASTGATTEAKTAPSPPVVSHVQRPPDSSAEAEEETTAPPPRDFFNGTPYADATEDSQQRTMVAIQMELGRRGFYRGAIDGMFGPGTSAALREFQEEMELPVTGRPDRLTLRAMRLLPGQGRMGPRIFSPPRVYRGEWVPE